ncbi:MAG TPA: PA2169 family four-helix-bundle protein [Alphaproteobacteria bacterium]|nr:PA2169 family four-helix-bundle protein [Alphaproteobacteria bacterium]
MSKQDNKEIRKVIDINKDAVDFYSDAKSKAKDNTVKDIFQKFEKLHNDVVINLQNYVRQNGGEPEAENTVAGRVGQFWGDIKAKISNDVDESLISSLEEAEDRCIHAVSDAADNKSLSPETRIVLKQEKTLLQKTHDYMKIMKDNAKAA